MFMGCSSNVEHQREKRRGREERRGEEKDK